MDGTSVANCEELKMPNAKKQRPKQCDSVNAHRVDKGRRINRFRAIKLAKGREALALKRAAPPSDNHHRPPDVGVPSPVAGTSKDHSPPQSRGYHPPYKVRRPDRYAKLNASKHGCDDSSSDNEDVLPDPVTQVRGEIVAVFRCYFNLYSI